MYYSQFVIYTEDKAVKFRITFTSQIFTDQVKCTLYQVRRSSVTAGTTCFYICMQFGMVPHVMGPKTLATLAI